MLRQTTIFDAIAEATIRPHNNRDSQRQCEDNMEHFRDQNLWVFNYLMTGKVLTEEIARFGEAKVKDLRARIHSIKKAGFLVTPLPIPNSHGSLNRVMTPEQIEFNRLHRPEAKRRLKK